MVVSTSELMAARAEEGVHLVEEHHHRHVLVGLLLGLHEDLPDLALRLAHVLVQQLRALDVQEEALDLLAALLRDLLGQVVRDRLGDHRLAAAGRAVEQHALGRRELVLLVVVGVEVRQLHRVLDRLDLLTEPADVVVADVRHFLEREVFHLALGQLLEQVAALGVHEQVIAGLETGQAERVGDDPDLLLIRPQGDDGALKVELLLENDDVALHLVASRLDDVEALVEDQLLARLERVSLDARVNVDLQLSPTGQQVHRAVDVGGQEDPVGCRRGRQLVDLLAQRHDLLAGLLEGGSQAILLAGGEIRALVCARQLVVESARVVSWPGSRTDRCGLHCRPPGVAGARSRPRSDAL
jgi:hypothetical protein